MSVCPWCGGKNALGVCPKAVACPRCGAEPGQRCRRPSGHLAPTLHTPRVQLAEIVSAAEGIDTFPAAQLSETNIAATLTAYLAAAPVESR